MHMHKHACSQTCTQYMHTHAWTLIQMHTYIHTHAHTHIPTQIHTHAFLFLRKKHILHVTSSVRFAISNSNNSQLKRPMKSHKLQCWNFPLCTFCYWFVSTKKMIFFLCSVYVYMGVCLCVCVYLYM